MTATPTEINDMTYPLLPLRDVVVYPHMVVPLFVGREKSITALEDAMENDKQVVLLAQRNPADDNPELKDLYSVGTLATRGIGAAFVLLDLDRVRLRRVSGSAR